MDGHFVGSGVAKAYCFIECQRFAVREICFCSGREAIQSRMLVAMVIACFHGDCLFPWHFVGFPPINYQ